MKTITLAQASTLQNSTLRFANQNNNIRTAIDALKSITHQPLSVIPNSSKLSNQNEYLGVNDDDRKTINDFIKFLETKEIPMRDLFECIINDEE